MAYAAVISLKQTIQRLLNSSRISILPHRPEIEEFAYKEIQSLQEVLERLDGSSSSSSSRERLNALDGQIREAVHKLEDLLESHVSNQLLSQSESHGDDGFPHILSLDSEEVRQEINSFAEMVMKIKEEYIKELDNPLPEEEDDAVSSRINFGGKKSKIVGLSGMISRVKKAFVGLYFNVVDVTTVSLYGMAGIGKTTLAKEIFEDLLILSNFECRVWVTVGPKYQLKEMLLDILAQVDPENDTMRTAGNEKLEEYLRKCFKYRKIFVVLDDVWSKHVWDDLYRLLKKNGEANGVLLTTRLEKVACSTCAFDYLHIPFLDEQESWHLLREKLFVEELCPPELEKTGKKIAENCEGLPLTIVTVADLLSKAERTSEYWDKVAEKKNSVFMDAYDLMSKVLFPSYNYLPQHLKVYFLYMGVFPENCKIPISKLIKLWSAEGFLESIPSETREDFAMECVEKLVSESLVLVGMPSSNYGIKACVLHSAFWHLCIKEARKNKLFHVLNSFADCTAEGMKGQRRLSIHKNVLFGIKDAYNSMSSISSARSLLCAGPPLQYPVPICFGLRLLRVLDALAIRFYEFPIEVLKLVQLRFLALTYNGNLPASISKLWNLQFLIIGQHLSIKSPGVQLYLPMEIWDMIELKHLQIMGSNLPDPNHGALLPNLLTLVGVSAHSCTKAVLERIPSLKKLGIRIELEADAVKPLCCFDHISHLHRLESLKCVIMNPKIKPDIVAPPVPLAVFPSSLKKLTLSGFGYPWEEMSKIASLPNLEELKLQYYAFQGRTWEIYDKGFLHLKFLLIEDTDLVHWIIQNASFPSLVHLSLKHCYKLEEIPTRFLYVKCLELIEIVDCNPLAVLSAKQMRQDREKLHKYLDLFDGEKVASLFVGVHSSWDDGNLKS